MRQFPDAFANLLKDGLRGARYVARHGARHGQEAVAFAPGVPEFARLAGSVLTATEKTASALLLGERLDFDESDAVAEEFAALLAAPGTAQRKRRFVRLQYRLIALVLRRLGVENVFVSEHAIAVAYELLCRRHRRIVAALRPVRGGTAAETVRFWVAAAVVLGACQPLREIDLPRGASPQTERLRQAPAPYCLLIVALAGATLTARHPAGRAGKEGLDRCIDSATAVVTARFDRLRAAFTQADAVDTLAEEFAAVLPFLP